MLGKFLGQAPAPRGQDPYTVTSSSAPSTATSPGLKGPEAQGSGPRSGAVASVHRRSVWAAPHGCACSLEVECQIVANHRCETAAEASSLAAVRSAMWASGESSASSPCGKKVAEAATSSTCTQRGRRCPGATRGALFNTRGRCRRRRTAGEVRVRCLEACVSTCACGTARSGGGSGDAGNGRRKGPSCTKRNRMQMAPDHRA